MKMLDIFHYKVTIFRFHRLLELQKEKLLYEPLEWKV